MIESDKNKSVHEKEEVGKKRERDFTEESQENVSETSLQERTGFFFF